MKKNTKNIFLDSLVGVKPIKKSNKIKKPIPVQKSNTIIFSSLHLKKKPSVSENLIEKKISKQSGIETKTVNKKLKKGRIPINKRIDFHGLSLLDAENLFLNTVKDCFNKNKRCILFITGKGIKKKILEDDNKTKLYYGKIRSGFLNWINNSKVKHLILSLEQANLEHGADGAFFVYLRKKKF